MVKTAVVVGLGTAGRRHVHALKTCCPELHIIGVSRSQRYADEVDELVDSLDAAIASDPAVAVIAGPAPSRIETALLLADQGIHLFLEKPLAVSMAGIASLAELAADRGLTVAVGYNLRFFEPLRVAKQMIDEGSLGDLYGARAEVGQYLPDWRPGVDYRTSVSARHESGGGALLELSHELDYVSWILGEPVAVSASVGRLGSLEIDVEDTVEMIVTFASGVFASVHQDMLQRPAFRRARFFGQFGSLEVDLIQGDITIWTKPAPEGRKVAVSNRELRTTYVAQIEDFLRAVSSGKPPKISLDVALTTLRVIMAARMSASSGRRISIDEISTDHE